MSTTKEDSIYSMKDGHCIHGSWLQKSLDLLSLAKENKQKQRKTKKLHKKVKNALDTRFVIDCLGLAVKKKKKDASSECIFITELEHKHGTGSLFHCITANNAVFASESTDTDELVHGGVHQFLCCHTADFHWEIGGKCWWQQIWITPSMTVFWHLNLKKVNVQLHLSKESNRFITLLLVLKGKRTKTLVKMWTEFSVQQRTL